jgi:clan AA aspartic protease (TIGR02281 family)
MKFLVLIAIFLLGMNTIVAQDVVKMEKENGVYKIPCKINGLPLKFIFDTGASNVSISLTEALFMLKNGYLKETDIRGTIYYSIANGEIAEGTIINLQKIEVGKQLLYNVEASIMHSSEAPLLFGQSAMERFGKFTMDYSNANLIIGNTTNSTSDNVIATTTIKSVKIGTQTWMSENINVTAFRNGEQIPEAKSVEEWRKANENKQPSWCYYEFDPNNGIKYGKLYNWYVLKDTRGIAPVGWKVPLAKDYEKLFKYLDPKTYYRSASIWDSLSGVYKIFGSSTIGEKLKSKTDWENSSIHCGIYCNGNNLSGFNAKPSSYTGNFYNGRTNYYFGRNDCCFLWTGEIQNPFENGYGIEISSENYANLKETKTFDGLSIRCIKE